MSNRDSHSDDAPSDTGPPFGTDRESPEPLTIRVDAEAVAEAGLDTVPKEDLETALRDALAAVVDDPDPEDSSEESLGTEDMYVARSHQYAMIDPSCPVCGGTLAFVRSTEINPRMGPPIKCKNDHCGWRGRAIYEFIDLEQKDGDRSWSAVTAGELTPTYHNYEHDKL